MTVRSILQIGHPALKATNSSIRRIKSTKTKKLIDDLRDTMRKNGLVGISAPQIGENYKIFVTEPRKTKTRTIDQSDKFRVYINPKIINFSKIQNIIYEGCGSVINGKLFGPVKRPKTITIQATDENGDKFQLKCDGLLGRVIQHEYDHLFGIEFTEKIFNYRKLVDDNFYIKRIKGSNVQINPSKIKVKDYKKL